MRVLLVALVILLAAPAATAKAPPPPELAAVVPTGRAPCGITAYAGSLWVGVYETGELLQLDASTGRTRARIPVGEWACRVAVGPGAIWVTRDNAGELVRISRATGRVRRLMLGAGVFDVLLARGSVWTTSHDIGVIAQSDPATGRSTRIYKDGPKPVGLAACGGRIWVGHGRPVTWVTSIEPRLHRKRRVPTTVEGPRDPTCIDGVVWVTTEDSVVRIDARTGRLLTVLRVGETLGEAAAGPDGLVWVTDKQHSVIHRLTPDGRHVLDTFPAGPAAFALARAGNAMWVTSFAGSDIRRFVP